jgi:hypothetical protein
VRGIIDYDLSAAGSSLKDLRSKYDDVREIMTVGTNDNGSPEMQHWELEAK